MMIEQNTNYAYKLKYTENPTFDKVRDLAIKFMRELPKQLQDELYEALNRGIDILDSEPQMVTYLYAFGPMHQAKLNYAFKHLPEKFAQPEINIIDYGCGQALGTMCYADFLRENGYAQKVKTITLIEPSEMCLKRATLHASVFFPDAEIKTVSKNFDELEENDFYCDEDIPTLHILSNVLDILDFDLEDFSDLIKGQLKGYNQFVCVGPYFNYSDKDERMNDFISLLDGKEEYREVFDKYEFDPEKTWTAQIQCFSASELFSTEASENDIKNGVVDEFGVIYSIDGKRLLKCKNKSLESYYIKSGTKIISDYAFDGFLSLQQIIIPDSVKSIGDGAFIDCSSLQQIIIPDSVTCIGDGVFLNCSSLQQITIPDSVISFDNIAFLGCSSLKQIKIPSSVTRIDQLGFYGCNSLQEITMSDSVTRIGRDAFEGCASLQQINIPSGRMAWFKLILDKKMWDKLVEYKGSEILSPEVKEEELDDAVEDEYGVLYSGDGNRLLKCKNKNIESYNVRQGTKTICDSAFLEIGTLKQIVIPDSVTNIEDQAFCGCKSLQKIDIPNSVTSIGYNAFGLCQSLQRINIPDSVTFLGPTTFHKCISLQQVTISKSLARIDYMTFCECNSLQQIVIPNSITVISDWAFSECKSLKQITISNSLSHLGTGAFAKCESLEQVTLPDSVHSIGDSAFEECKNLQQIIIPKESTKKFKKMLDEKMWDKLVEQ